MNSVLSHSVRIEEGAEVHYSVLMPGVTVKKGAVVRYAILGENCQVAENAKIGGDPESCDPETWGITVLGPGSTIEAARSSPPTPCSTAITRRCADERAARYHLLL